MNSINDALRPTPEQRAAPRLKANAEWLARVQGSQFDEANRKIMERDNKNALAGARKSIEAERKAQKCYCCGRQNVPRLSWWCWGWSVALLLVYLNIPEHLYVANVANVTALPYLVAFAIGAGIGSGVHENSNLK